MKKTLIIITGLVLVTIAVFLSFNFKSIKRFYLAKTIDLSTGTGAIESTPNPQDLVEADAMDKLQKSLPYSTSSFVISSFDYKKGKFNIEFKTQIENSAEEFVRWLQTSEFKEIPIRRFAITN